MKRHSRATQFTRRSLLSLRFRSRGRDDRSFGRADCGDAGHKVPRYMLEMGLHSGGMERFVVTQEGKIAGVVFEMGLRRNINKGSASIGAVEEREGRRTLSFSELTTSFLISLILASLTAAFVTALNPSSILYLNPSTCFMSNLYSLISPPFAF